MSANSCLRCTKTIPFYWTVYKIFSLGFGCCCIEVKPSWKVAGPPTFSSNFSQNFFTKLWQKIGPNKYANLPVISSLENIVSDKEKRKSQDVIDWSFETYYSTYNTLFLLHYTQVHRKVLYDVMIVTYLYKRKQYIDHYFIISHELHYCIE